MLMMYLFVSVFFFKQKTAYAMRISDWSSDVCSSDLSEFILTAQGPVLVEINYRSIGDGREFLLDRLLPQGWFDRIVALHLGDNLIDAQPAQAEATVHYLVADRAGRLDQASASFNVEREGHWRSEEHTSELQSLMRISYAV